MSTKLGLDDFVSLVGALLIVVGVYMLAGLAWSFVLLGIIMVFVGVRMPAAPAREEKTDGSGQSDIR